uniref:Uncharacterized protein n=1 Tax=Rhizophora mucronata TaxID=61149 RepID=A0A2P2R5D5_RHIMU
MSLMIHWLPLAMPISSYVVTSRSPMASHYNILSPLYHLLPNHDVLLQNSHRLQ